MANGMASLYVGATGLKSAQTALNTTSHNLSNINTEGYTRQQIAFTDTQYVIVKTKSTTTQGTYGLGVNVSEIRRVRDEFIDKAYRLERSRLGFYESQYKAVEEVEDLFGEMQGVNYQSYITDLYNAVNELTKNPTSTVARSSLIQNATAFLDKSEAIYKGLKDYQTTLNTEVENMVNTINDLGNKIYTLNKRIAKIESAGIEDANDLRDQRDSALDELSKYIDLTYYEADNGEVVITTENAPFVTIGGVIEMGTRMVEGTNLIIPTWPSYERDVYNFSKPASNASDTDKGELKGLLIARGNMDVDYTDVPVMPDSADYDLTTAKGQEDYNKAMDEYQEKQKYYDTYIEPSVILSAIAGFDKLVNTMVEAINNVLCPETTLETGTELYDGNGNALQADTYTYNASSHNVLYTRFGEEVEGIDNGDGTFSFVSEEKLFTDKAATQAEPIDSMVYSILDMDKTDYGMDEQRTVGTELFKRKETERYVEITSPNGSKMYVRNNLNNNKYESLYALGNLEMNPVSAQNVATIPLSTEQGKEDFAKANELLDTFSAKIASLNPGAYAKSDFNTFYNNYIGEFATMGSVLGNFVSNQDTMVTGYNNQRLQTEGVSSDEELEKMIKYQHAYNAASRYINVVSEMLEHLVTALGNA
ncbi:MAG: flagellar hook-associated protein FlgK [Eubacteriales bacterium]|nr:flagellar hook-associated protein FlgK [Eubacteriales bacterium]